jgi:hypothetical protein
MRRKKPDFVHEYLDRHGKPRIYLRRPGQKRVPLTPVYTKDFDADGVRRDLYEASKDRTTEWRGTSNSPGTFTAPA